MICGRNGGITPSTNREQVAIMPEDKVAWVSRAMMDSTLIKSFRSDLCFADLELAVDAMRRVERGEPVPPGHHPKAYYGKYIDKRMGAQPDIFCAGGDWVVSAAFAQVLRRFDLGRTTLCPTRLFQYDRKTPVPGDYFYLGFGEAKEALLPGESPKAVKPYADREIWKISLDPKDDDIAVGASALEGVDLWLDPRLWYAFFLSDHLVTALRSAKLTRRLGLRRCRVIRSS